MVTTHVPVINHPNTATLAAPRLTPANFPNAASARYYRTNIRALRKRELKLSIFIIGNEAFLIFLKRSPVG